MSTTQVSFEFHQGTYTAYLTREEIISLENNLGSVLSEFRFKFEPND
jgi:hypothetical protein